MTRPIILLFFILFISCNQQNTQNHKTDLVSMDSSYFDSLLFDNDTIMISKIDSVSFHNLFASTQVSDTIPYLYDVEEVKKLLIGKIELAGFNSETNELDSSIPGTFLSNLHFSVLDTMDTKKFAQNLYVDFVRYYPTEEIVLFEGGHTSDYSIDLKNERLGPELVGNPAYIIYSPNKNFRLNGWFPGQECSSYFIQKNEKGVFNHFSEIPLSLTEQGFDLCNLTQIRWIHDQEMIFKNTFFDDNKDNRLGYFKLRIK